MQNKNIFKKIMWIAGASCALAIVYFVLNSAGITQKIAFMSNFIVENSHTGIAGSPGVQVALNDLNKNASQFASDTSNKNSESNQAAENQAVAAGQLPKVLFDISAQPFFAEMNQTNIFLWFVFAVIVALLMIYFIYRIYKRRKLEKIKSIN